MRTVTIILSILFTCYLPGSLGWGKPAGNIALNNQVERKVNRAVTTPESRPAASHQKNATQKSQRQTQIIQALDRVRVKEDSPQLDKHIVTSDKFEILNERETILAQQKLEKWNQLGQEASTLLSEYGDDMQNAHVYAIEQKRPDYAQETKGLALIYLTDFSGHSTLSIVQEVKRVMQDVRRANPHAHILLATEFAAMTDFKTPIRFAGKTNNGMSVEAPYDALLPLANRLGMDILSLDDAIIFPWEAAVGWKIGKNLLYIPISYDDLVRSEIFYKWWGFINASTLGMKLRNEQWASYLRAVQPFYDIILVYGGNGHIDSSNMPFLDVPIQLGGKYAVFNFATVEQNHEEEVFADHTYQMLCNANACVQVPLETLSAEQEGAIEWDGKTIMYAKTDMRAFNAFSKTLPTEKQAQLTELINKNKQAGFKNVEPAVHFMVYLPDVTQ